MAALDAAKKTEIYHTLYQLNSAFAAIVRHCDALRQAGVLTPKYTHLFQGFAQEVQADINLELLEFMDSIESEDWARFGKVREKWEKYLRFESSSKPKPRKKTNRNSVK
jgi:hypothetical protein